MIAPRSGIPIRVAPPAARSELPEVDNVPAGEMLNYLCQNEALT